MFHFGQHRKHLTPENHLHKNESDDEIEDGINPVEYVDGTFRKKRNLSNLLKSVFKSCTYEI